MSNPTTPFGWQMPTATDLVTDLPADFEVFGQAVATSMGDLLGGTSGQILAKNSNTDMDFVWVTNDVGDITAVTAGTGISGGGTSGAVTVTNSMATTMTTKGDLVPATGSGTFARLAAGSNGETLVADSSTSTGLRYQATKSTQQAIINGAFDNWQRGTSFTTTSIYSADRWFTYLASGSGATWSRQAGSGEFQYVMRLARNNGTSNTTAISINQPVAIEEATQFAGKTVTLSFYAKAGANFSAASSAIGVSFYSGTGSTDVNRALSAYTGDVTVLNTTQVITTTLTRYSFTFTLGASVTQFNPFFNFTPVGTAGANDWFEITGIQLEVGSVATTFRRAGGTLQGELAACQRYYYQTAPLANKIFTTGQAYSTTAAYGAYQNPVTMRGVPSVSFSAAGDFDLFNATGSRLAVTALAGNAPNVDNIRLDATVASGLVAGNATVYIDDAGGNAIIKVSAEL